MPRKRFTPEEDALLLEYVAKYKNNLKLGFEEVAKLLNRSPDVCGHRWYRYLKIKKGKFATVSETGASVNCKNQKRGTELPIPSIPAVYDTSETPDLIDQRLVKQRIRISVEGDILIFETSTKIVEVSLV